MLLGNLLKLLKYLPKRRKQELLILLSLALTSALSEIVSLGALLPFLSALSNPSTLLENSHVRFFSQLLSISSPKQLSIWVTVIFITSVVVANVLKLVTLWFQSKVIAAMSNDISVAYYRSNLYQPYEFYLNHNSSDLIVGATELIDRTTGNVYACLNFLIYLITITAILIGLLFVDLQVTLSGIALLIILILPVIQVTRYRLANNSREIIRSSNQRIKILQESTGGMRDILLDGSHSFFLKKYEKTDLVLRQLHAANQFMGAFNRPYMEGIAITAIAFLALIMLQTEDGLLKVLPVLGALVLGLNRLLPALQQCYSCWAWMKSNGAALAHTLTALERPIVHKISDMPGKSAMLNHSLRLERIWFRYESTSDWVLKGLEISILANTTVGFVGESGCGKSTTADLILGLLQPQEGHITVNNLPLRDNADRLAWQRTVAHVPQSIYLCDASIAENIAFGVDPTRIDLARVKEAARLASIHKFIEHLPHSYEQEVGERGVRLSGGQRQRIGIARALYKQASVIIFDEATSALDGDTEQEVMNALYSLESKVTLIIIAHRLSTLRCCSRIFEFQDGKATIAGSYDEMVTLSARFARLASK